jgi:ABC-type nitrate/sulfonate/bicarbonate transport system substrate-binding protein
MGILVDKISFPYRSSSHLVLLHVVAESGAWEKHGLDVNYNFQITKKEAHRAVPLGEIEFVGGNHISAYGHRARGDTWVYLGQTVNQNETKLAVRRESGINSVSDLRGRVVGTRGNHPGLNDWLFLKQRGLDTDRDDVELVNEVDGDVSMEAAEQFLEGPTPKKKRSPVWQWVRDGKVDAALLTTPASLFAEDAGLKLIDLEPMPMIYFTTISSSLGFVKKNPDIVDRFLKAMIEGIHYFKTHEEQSIKIIEEKCTKGGKLNLAQATILYQTTAKLLEPKLYPSMAAILNVYEEAKRADKDSAKVNPMELWDLHHLRQIDDSGFIRNLYQNSNSSVVGKVDPDRIAEKKKHDAEMVAAFKKS